MKPNIFSYIRNQKKLVRFVIFFISWTQVYGYSYASYLGSPESGSKNSYNGYNYSPKTKGGSNDSGPAVSETRNNPLSGKIEQPNGNASFSVPAKTISNTNVSSEPFSSVYYNSDIKEGIIGKDKDHPIDQVFDNIFNITVDELPKGGTVTLEYDLFGVSDYSGISKVVNDERFSGGSSTQHNQSWAHQSEPVKPGTLVKGLNTILFTISPDANYTYRVKNVRFKIASSKNSITYDNNVNRSLSGTITKEFFKGQKQNFSIGNAGLETIAGSISENTVFSITPLEVLDIPALSPEMVNVTSENAGYRFLPHGEHFKVPAKVTLGYDKNKIPAGYTERDIKTYFFDRVLKKWIALEKDSLVSDKKILVSKTTHFTDMINGIIKVPESPETGSYAPNSIKDIKAADPVSGIVSLSAPAPNNQGSVNTSFPIKLPAGRQGMQPSLSVNYNSDGGNGWMGMGWDLSVPAVTIDTRWGVPTYDQTVETELYTLGGEQLAFEASSGVYAMPNRNEGFEKNRTSDRQFHPRIEGAYNKIIRKGTNPKDYVWIVISKDGTRSYFGGDEAGIKQDYVLKDADGNIGHWALYKTVDTNKNYLEYFYDRTPYSGSTANGGQQIYPSRIDYTLHETDNPPKHYSVTFSTDSDREDVQIDGRLGFLKVVSKRLTGINVSYGTEKVRSYQFSYVTGAFKKQLLSDIKELDAADQEFYTNKIEYNQVPSQIFGTPQTWTAPDIANFSGLAQSLQGGYSLLSGNYSSNLGGNFRIGVGIGDVTAIVPDDKAILSFNKGTFGALGGYSRGNSKTQIMAIDIDGDNLPDRVYMQDDGIYYSKNMSKAENGAQSFGAKIKLNSLSNIGKSSSDTWNVGLSATFGSADVGFDYSNSTSSTKSYFMDFNNDQLIDFVKDGKVYFNSIVGGIPTFNPDSGVTPYPINITSSGAQPSTSLFDDNDKAEKKTMLEQNPLHDVVRVWVAPRTGTVTVKNSFNLQNVQCGADEDCSLADGVAVSFQYKTDMPLVQNINAGDYNIYSFTDQVININKGEKLYFRISSKYNGALDQVNWNPEVTYNTSISPAVDSDNRNLDRYDSFEDFVNTTPRSAKANDPSVATSGYIASADGTLNLMLSKPIALSDNAEISVSIDGISYDFPISQSDIYNDTVVNSTALSVNQEQKVVVKVRTSTQIDWTKFKLIPEFTETATGKRTFLPVEYTMYNNRGEFYTYQPTGADIGKKILVKTSSLPNFNNRNGRVVISAKFRNRLLTKTTYEVINNNNTVVTTYGTPYTLTSADIASSELIYLETTVDSDDPDFINTINSINGQLVSSDLNYINEPNNLSLQLPNANSTSHSDGTIVISQASTLYFVLNNYAANTSAILSITDTATGTGVPFPNGTLSGQPGLPTSTTASLPPGIYTYNLNFFQGSNPSANTQIFITNGGSETNMVSFSNTPPHKPILTPQSITTALGSNEYDNRFGSLYRGWGGFILNGNNPAKSTIVEAYDLNSNFANAGTAAEMKVDEAGLKLSDAYGTSTTTNPTINYPTTDANGNVIINNNDSSLSQNYFLTVSSNINNTDKGRLEDVDPAIYISQNVINVSRLNIRDIDNNFVNNTLSQSPGSELNAPNLKSRNQSVSDKFGVNIGLSIGQSRSIFNENKSLRSLIDFNGDGFPDDFAKTNVKLSNPIGFLSSNSKEVGSEFISKADFLGVSAGYSFKHASSAPTRWGIFPMPGVALGTLVLPLAKEVSTTVSINTNLDIYNNQRSKQAFVDINGDGLPDKFNDGNFELNVGNQLVNNESWGTGEVSTNKDFGKGAGLGISLFKGSFEGGINTNTNTSTTQNELLDINGDGINDNIEYNGSGATVTFNKGNGFTGGETASVNSKSIVETLSLGGNVGFTIPITIIVPPSTIGVKLMISAGVSAGEAAGKTKSSFKDMNGDGYLDYVTSDDANNVTVSLNQIGITNLLKKVTLPTGGSWEVTYERKGNTYEMPQSRYVMTSVIVKDGFAQDDQFKPGVSKITVSYNNPYHSRRERTFYGFNEVRIDQINTANGGANATQVFRYTVQHFNNSSYFLKGSLLDETLFDASNRKWTETINTITARALSNTNLPIALPTYEAEKALTNYAYFVTANKTVSNFYEGQTTAGKSTYSESLAYDNYGNLTGYRDYGDQQIGSNDILNSIIEYQITDSGTDYMILPNAVINGATGVLRERVASYDPKGNLMSITMTGGGNPMYSYQYDIYGNISKATLPQNANGETFWHQYTYDNDLKTYPVAVEDAFGYSSSTEYDYRFGVPAFTTDMNLQPTQYTYDAKGRLTTVTGPYELFNDIPWTIQMEYHPVTNAPVDATTAQSYAVTKHYDPEIAGNTINTVSIADGLGTAIQLKKTAVIYDSQALKGQYIVSGKVVQDAFGRALKSYYPTVGLVNNFYDPSVDNIEPTTSTYDVLDRVLTTRLPGEQLFSKVQYDFGNDRLGRKMFHTQFTDELGSIKHNFADIKGRTTTVHEESNTGDIVTSFTHDAIGELLQVKDVENHLTASIYDDLGRRVSITQPDNGTSTFTYDPAGNPTSKTTAENETVTYQYDYNRLKGITYPNYPENNVAYYYGQAQNASAADDNAVGRLWYQTDASGTQRLKYGKLGELTSQRRSVATPDAGIFWYGTEWEYDTWNRVKNITYPDGEKLTYSYNRAGNLNNMVSVKDGHSRILVRNIGYDKFEQRVYLRYGNDTETTYEYENERRRLLKMNVENSTRSFMDNLYQYDVVSNVLQTHNNAPAAPAGLLGGGTNYAYGYDDLYRLTSANGNWKGKTDIGTDLRHRYTYTMAYDNMHNVMSKVQKHETAPGNTGNDWTARYDTSYMLNYKYEGSQPHAPSTIIDQPNIVPTTTCCDPNDPGVKFMHYAYDAKGNPTGINKETCTVTEAATTHIWDEENRLQAVDTNPSTPEADGIAMYTYDAGGERIMKQVYAGSYTIRTPFGPIEVPYYTYTLYPNGLVSMNLSFDRRGNTYRRNYTKHYYAGTQRISGALGSSVAVGDFNCNWLIIPFGAGGAPINEKDVALQKAQTAKEHTKNMLERFGINGADYGQGGGYDGDYCATDFSGQEELDVYWYHPDHLGSSSFITGIDGEVNQNIEYFPSGETFVENHLNSYNVPYKFNSKELDDETGYYYYGARYYNPRTSLWLNVDPLASYNPIMEIEHYIDGQHNGGVYNSGNLNPYIYCYQNPVIYVDPNGKQSYFMTPPSNGGEAFGRFFKGFGNFFKDSYQGAKFSITNGYYINWGTPAQMQLARQNMMNSANAFAVSITSGEALKSIGEALQTPEGWGYATAMISTFVVAKRLNASIGSGSLTISEGSFSASEISAARYMAGRGSKVILRDVIEGGAQGRTSDLLVDGLTYDVYTPKTSSVKSIVSAIRSKNSQAQGIVVDLSESSLKPSDLNNILKRVQGAGAKNIKDIVVMPKK
ncbi:SpvB/TcaC N-terminal domain-containing protein [Epilithonimonas hungarica]|uniref:RHS repeat-associated core domain-containing protein n=1 Tax=Epilithonimonas hungarica TaxID=454006 RepID=A0A1G7TNR0_9FLAO|nr:SpvB/TcaC N-terminal domain-containing protein [Epilithonimonas hungarica]SDG36968.1 RHS repeat-associated core domain-containing protein [Epilithonimonas hungarica]